MLLRDFHLGPTIATFFCEHGQCSKWLLKPAITIDAKEESSRKANYHDIYL